MNAQKLPILLNCLAAVMGAFGQFCYKRGAVGTANPLFSGCTLSGVIFFCAVMVLFSLSSRLGGRLSVVYPFYATVFVWGTLIGVWFDREPWHPNYVLGLGLILAGVSIIAWSSERA